MKVPTVNKFLCFFDLTTGGLVLGYVGAVTNAGLAFLLFYDLFHDVKHFKTEVMDFGLTAKEIEMVEEFEDENYSETFLTQSIFVILAILIFGILIGCCVISIWFVQGVKERDARKVKYFLVIMAFGTCTTFFKGVLTLSFMWILMAMANVYFFIVVYSLYQVLMSEDGEQVKSHLTATTKGYQQCYESTEEDIGENSVFNEP